jgi:hypothetical protein
VGVSLLAIQSEAIEEKARADRSSDAAADSFPEIPREASGCTQTSGHVRET